MPVEASMADLQAVLATYLEPNLRQSLGEARAIAGVERAGAALRVTLELGFPVGGYEAELAAALQAHLAAAGHAIPVVVVLRPHITAHAVQRGLAPLAGIRNLVAVASGKGGVGKSTVAANLALALAQEGARVGVLDADIYGPSQPTMLGMPGKPRVAEEGDNRQFIPLENYGVQCMSIGMLIDPDQAVAWRGPMATGALEQLLRDTRWNDLDYLVVDMPPGTGDIQLTLAQKVPVTGAVIVTTPQNIALLDARKGLKMFEKVNVPILGIVENMSLHVCSKCGHEEHIFGTGGGEAMSTDYGVPLLGALPLDIRIREQADSGQPTVVADPGSRVAGIYREIARRVGVKVAELSKDSSTIFPKIVIQNT